MKTLIFVHPDYPHLEIWVILVPGSTKIKVEYHIV
jgi:hypothetical protein